jgi:hypothetical protein
MWNLVVVINVELADTLEGLASVKEVELDPEEVEKGPLLWPRSASERFEKR